jgi:hypothetical protein
LPSYPAVSDSLEVIARETHSPGVSVNSMLSYIVWAAAIETIARALAKESTAEPDSRMLGGCNSIC